MDDEYRCHLTIDLEEYIMSFDKPDKYDNIEAIVHYKSGRTEIFHSRLNNNQQPRKAFCERMQALKDFPTVTKIDFRKY